MKDRVQTSRHDVARNVASIANTTVGNAIAKHRPTTPLYSSDFPLLEKNLREVLFTLAYVNQSQ